MPHRLVAVSAILLGFDFGRCRRSLLTKPFCDGDSGNSQAALSIPEPSISCYFSHYLDSMHRTVWMKFGSPADNFKFCGGMGTPPIFSDLRADTLIIGPGLPEMNSTDFAALPEQVHGDLVWTNASCLAGIWQRNPADPVPAPTWVLS